MKDIPGYMDFKTFLADLKFVQGPPRPFRKRQKFMIPRPTKLLVRISFCATIASALLASASQAQHSSPFGGMSGGWAGPGTLTLNTGTKERIRCRAQYNVADSGADLKLELRCASDTYKFELQGSISHNAGSISGTWSEVTRGAIGNISGTTNGNQLNLRASSPVFSALLGVTTRGNQQSISIQSPGSEIFAVAITLSKGAK